jgi:hypothetical protein
MLCPLKKNSNLRAAGLDGFEVWFAMRKARTPLELSSHAFIRRVTKRY